MMTLRFLSFLLLLSLSPGVRSFLGARSRDMDKFQIIYSGHIEIHTWYLVPGIIHATH